MKAIYFLIYIFSITAFSQTESLYNNKYQFAKDVFETKYSKQHYNNWTKIIEQLPDGSLKYDDKTLIFLESDNPLKSIFTKGIFYPNIIDGNTSAKIKTKDELAKMNEQEILLYNFTRTDSIKISSLEELPFLNPNPQTKRFKFWHFNPGSMNPTECYFELFNSKANSNTPITEFIDNAKLTFYYRGTIIL